MGREPELAGWPTGCPSTQTAPPTKNSFFQIGTVLFSASIAKRHASNAAARCGALTPIHTLVSPISTRPNRCTIATRSIANRARASAPISRIFAERHRFVRFVFQVARLLPLKVVAHKTIKRDQRAILRPTQIGSQRRRIDFLAHQLKRLERHRRRRRRSAAHRRQKRYLVASRERRLQLAIFLIARRRNRISKLRQFWELLAVPFEEIAHRAHHRKSRRRPAPARRSP